MPNFEVFIKIIYEKIQGYQGEKTMRKIIFYLLLSLLFVSSLFGYDYTYSDLGIAHRISQIEDKILLIMFSSPSCYYCKLFDKDVITNKSVQEFLRGNYVFVKIEPSSYKTTFLGKSYTNNDLFSAFGVRGTPTFVFIRNKESITQVPGYRPAEDFLKALKYIIRVVEKNYKEPFDSYSKKSDDLKGYPKIVNVDKANSEYILKYDKNAQLVSDLPKDIDVYKVYVTKDEDVAKKLVELGAIRVLLVK